MLFLISEVDLMCNNIAPLINLVKNAIIPAIQIGVPIILIVLGMLDLGKAVIASKEDEIKAAQKLLIKRAIYAVAIFFVVLAVTAVFSVVGKSSGEDTAAWTKCWTGDYEKLQ